MSPTEIIERKPCATCPYRQDAPRELWQRVEFEGVLANDHEWGAVYGCHKYQRKDPVSLCAGWLLDQRRRNFPNFNLRMMFLRRPQLAETAENLSTGDAELFESIEDMCIANGVDP